MQNKRGVWHLLSIVSLPFMVLARSGIFGRQAQEEAEVALEDWAAYGRTILPVLIAIPIVIILILLYALFG